MRSRWVALLLSPIGLLLLSAFRLLVISKYNTTTAITIAESGGYINTLLGSVIPLLPVFIPYVALFLLLAEQYTLTIIAFTFTIFISLLGSGYLSPRVWRSSTSMRFWP